MGISNCRWAPGWSFQVTNGLLPVFSIHDDVGGVDSITGDPLDPLAVDSWYHYMVFCDRDEANPSYYLRAYKNGNLISSLPSGYTVGGNTLENAGLLTFGADSDGLGAMNSGVAMVRVWTHPNMFPGSPDNNLNYWTPVAFARHRILTQTWT